MKKAIVVITMLLPVLLQAQKTKLFQVQSPDGKVNVTVETGNDVKWSVMHETTPVITASAVSIRLQGGEVLGKNVQVLSSKKTNTSKQIVTAVYKKSVIKNEYNELLLTCKGGYGIVFRVFDAGAAYRFFTTRKGELIVESEQSEFNFDQDYKAFIPHTSDLRGGEKYTCSFEEFYTEAPVSGFNKDTLGYLPLLIELNQQKKAVILEADVQNYPGMFVQRNQQVPFGLQSTFASYPLQEALGGYNRIDYMVTRRADYIARVNGTGNFPWRIIAISKEDKELLNNDLVQLLSATTKIENTSWIKPGKVAWDWWNDWNISKVDFKAGINNDTYKYYIDFAAANHLEYIILDEGWSDDWDLRQLKSGIDLKELIAYGKQKNVGLILWSTWYALSKDIEGLCATYAAMGVKGFKVDFLDRNDQKMIASCYEMAAIAAKYQLLLDFHGTFPPQGLQTTWPNVINFEAVRGMEWMKWNADERVPRHELSLPFIRMMAGPMDYTPGAMRNATKGNVKASNASPMSNGTRCHQMAMYVIYEAPLQMLCDNPTIYQQEQECTGFISTVPTVFDKTVALDGKLGEYVVMARQKNNEWFVAAMTNWNARDITVDCSFLDEGQYRAELFKDGLNADKDATDYKREIIEVNKSKNLTIHLASGGGCILRITKL